MGLSSYLRSRIIPQQLSDHVDQLPKPLGSLGYDPWGYHKETVKYGFVFTEWLYKKYFRVEASGVENVPARGPVLLVANHSGQLPLDGLMIAYALASRTPEPRVPRAMIERFFPTVPYLGNMLNELGAVLGDPVNCAKMLANDEAIIVFPEGARGSGKLYRNRYQLQRFGNGFMHLAMKYNAQIVPVGVVGCEETMPTLANLKPLARMLGLPYLPLTLPAVLPAKVHLNFGQPMTFGNDDLPEEQIKERVDHVKAEIAVLIEKGLNERKRIY